MYNKFQTSIDYNKLYQMLLLQVIVIHSNWSHELEIIKLL